LDREKLVIKFEKFTAFASQMTRKRASRIAAALFAKPKTRV